jgi:oligopeptide transport system permease protein
MAVVGSVVILAAVIMAVFAPLIAPYDFATQTLADANAAPRWVISLFPSMKAQGETGGYVRVSDAYPLGADNLGRDLFSRIVYGARVSLAVAFVGPLFSIIVGMLVGLLSGYAGGRVDNLLMRVVDLMYAFPTTLLVILLMALFRAGFSDVAPGTFAYAVSALDRAMGGMLFIFIGIGLTSWMSMARLVRGQVLSVREKEYIEAAHSLGARGRSVVLRHILPNILGPVIVAETLTIPTYISYEAFLSFIGLGVNPPTPSWGSMISEGAQRITSYPNQALFPALALFLVMFAFNFLGDGLRDALDPRTRGTD